MVKLLPGQKIIGGASNFMWGSNVSLDSTANNARNTPAIQAQFKAANFQIMRCAIPPNSSNAYLDQTANACQAMGCAMLVILIHDNLTWNQTLVSYLGNRCLLYEFANEPDLYPDSFFPGCAPGDGACHARTYTSWWNSQIPTLRSINPNAAFIGPVMGVFDNLISGGWLQIFLQGTQSAGNLPDAISYHVYPCTGDPSSTDCAPKAFNYSKCYGQINALVQSTLGFTLPQCMTEWNIDASGPPASYTQDPAFAGTWVTNALNNMAQAGFAIACQWEISTQAPYPPRLEFQPMVNVIAQYMGSTTNSRLVGPDTPIGISIDATSNVSLNPNVIPDMKAIGPRWLRWLVNWSSIELSKGLYTFGSLDSVVQQCNSQGVNLLLVVASPPTWWLINATATDGSTYSVPSPQGTLNMAQALAQRYDGNHGFGTIQGIELGGEDYDSVANTSYVPLANTMNLCYPALKSAYPTLTVGPGATVQRSTSHMQYFWNGMWTAANGQFDFINSHYYTCQPANAFYDPSNDSVSNVPSFAHMLQLLQSANTTANRPGFPIWITETGFAINTNYGRAFPHCVTDSATQSNYLNYELQSIQALNQSAKLFINTLDFSNSTPTQGTGTSDGMSVYQGIPGLNGTTTPAYFMIQLYSENWGSGTTSTAKTRDVMLRARLKTGTATNTLDIMMRAGLKAVGNLDTKDIGMRAYISGAIFDSFQRLPGPAWQTASDGENWVQASGTGTASIVAH
jgi:hypothetical protein